MKISAFFMITYRGKLFLMDFVWYLSLRTAHKTCKGTYRRDCVFYIFFYVFKTFHSISSQKPAG